MLNVNKNLSYLYIFDHFETSYTGMPVVLKRLRGKQFTYAQAEMALD